MSQIKIKRNATPAANLAAAQTLLDTLTFSAGEPVIVRYVDGSFVSAIFAIGTDTGTGSDYYKLITSDQEVAALIAAHAAEYSAHPAAAGGSNFGLSQESYSTAEKNKLAGITLGSAPGNVPVLNASGKLDDSVIPVIAITETSEVASQAAMLALSAQVGDVAIRSDENKSYILKATPASTLANWALLKTPTDAVLSFNSRTGAITLTKSDVEGVLTGAISSHTHSYQPVDADLTAIAALAGTSGILKKTAANTWALDTNTYLTAITKAMVEAVLTGDISSHTHSAYLTAITKAMVEGVLTGAISSHTHSYQPVDADLTAIAALAGTSGILKKTAADTWALDTNTYLTAITKAMVEAVLTGTISSHNHSGTYQPAGSYQAEDADLTAIAALSGTTGLLKKTAANTWVLDTAAYITGITKAMIEAQLTGAITSHTHSYQPVDADLTAIAALSGTGILQRTGANTWAVSDIIDGGTF